MQSVKQNGRTVGAEERIPADNVGGADCPNVVVLARIVERRTTVTADQDVPAMIAGLLLATLRESNPNDPARFRCS
jgi:hypothetical protein